MGSSRFGTVRITALPRTHGPSAPVLGKASNDVLRSPPSDPKPCGQRLLYSHQHVERARRHRRKDRARPQPFRIIATPAPLETPLRETWATQQNGSLWAIYLPPTFDSSPWHPSRSPGFDGIVAPNEPVPRTVSPLRCQPNTGLAGSTPMQSLRNASSGG